MFGLLHVFGHEIEASEALATPHTFQNIPGLLLTTAQPHILTSHQLPRHGQLLLENISVLG